MRFLFIMLFGLMFALSAPILMAQDKTIPYLDGIPVLQKFNVMDDMIVVFDKPQGQITEIPLLCETACPSHYEINEYYREIFLNMGWQADDVMGYSKDGRTVYMELLHPSEGSNEIMIVFRSMG